MLMLQGNRVKKCYRLNMNSKYPRSPRSLLLTQGATQIHFPIYCWHLREELEGQVGHGMLVVPPQGGKNDLKLNAGSEILQHLCAITLSCQRKKMSKWSKLWTAARWGVEWETMEGEIKGSKDRTGVHVILLTTQFEAVCLVCHRLPGGWGGWSVCSL